MALERSYYILLLSLPLFTSCAAPAIEMEGRYWYPDLSLEAKVEGGGIGTTIDFVDDLDVEDENFPMGRVKLYTGPNSWIRGEYLPISYDGDSMLTRSIIFDGKTSTVGARVITDFDFEYYRLGWGNQFFSFGDGLLQVGPLFEIKGYQLDASLVSPTPSVIVESEDITFGLPFSKSEIWRANSFTPTLPTW